MVNYPKEWSSLKYPNIRAELIAYLKDCCDLRHYDSESEVDFDIHFFFDDHDFYDDSKSMIGNVLFNHIEAGLIQEFTEMYIKIVKDDSINTVPVGLKYENLCKFAEKVYNLILRFGEPLY